MNTQQLKLIKATYEGRKVLVTGHTGFKGSWLIAWLSRLGAKVKGYALSPADHSLYAAINGDRLCTSDISDIRNLTELRKSILDFEPDFIFHMAAQPLVRYSYEEPVETWEVNIMGTVNVLESLRVLKKKCVAVFITTDKVYENREWSYGYREHDPLGGYDPYSASKAASEIVISSYRNSFFNNTAYDKHLKSIASVRAGNVIGGGDWARDRIVPDLVRAFQSGNTLEVRNPYAVRPWQHVIEPLGGYILLGAKMNAEVLAYNEAWNFGPFADDTLTVKELVEVAQKTLQFNIIAFDGGGRPHEATLLSLDITKSRIKLSWKPKYSAVEGIARTLQWYKSNFEGGDALQLINQDISDYTD